MGDFSGLITRALENIYNELVDVNKEIEPNLFKISFDSLNGAVDTGFGSISYDHPDFDFVNELKYNNGVFAAFKTHRQQNDLAAQLLDENGNLKTFDQFRKDTEAIIGDYNRNWLRTEYDTAVIRARMAARFKEFQRDADLYPNLRWEPSTSVVKRDLHVKLYGLTLPIDHPFWTKVFPGNLWNCKCGITNTDDPENGYLYDIDRYDQPAPPGLDGNPAFTGQIYSFSHPYIALGYLAYKKLKPIVNRWLKRHFKNSPPAFPIYKQIESTGKVQIRSTRYFRPDDCAKNEDFARRLASLYKGRETLKVYILPELKPDKKMHNRLRRYILPEATPEGRNPDYYINGKLFDLKQSSGTINTLRERFSEANAQAGNIMLDYSGPLTYNELVRYIWGRIKYYPSMEVWLVYKGKLYQFNHK